MKTPAVAWLSERSPRVDPGSPAPSWMERTTSVPAPMFAAAYAVPTAPAVDPAELQRQVDQAIAEGRVEGERSGREAGKEEIAAAITRLGESMERIEESARAAVRPYATELVELALIIARELVGAEVKRDPAPLIQLVERCLDDVVGELTVTIKLHPADRAVLIAARPDLLRRDLRVVEDPALARGGCLVESARRLVDARLEARLDSVRDGLRELLEEAAHAPVA
ncbi:MAG TPA: FliH/SctL family protein [Kofleriaceae bacterium]|nr:FliH/SctL family protein [Kofleriaceae bacterium]